MLYSKFRWHYEKPCNWIVCHQILSFWFFQVGDDENAYERLVDSMDASQVATNARVIMINPLSQIYPQIAIHIPVMSSIQVML